MSGGHGQEGTDGALTPAGELDEQIEQGDTEDHGMVADPLGAVAADEAGERTEQEEEASGYVEPNSPEAMRRAAGME